MSDSLSDLQTLIASRINAAADLAALTVVSETDGSAEVALDTAIAADGVGAIVLFPDLESGAPRDAAKAIFTVVVKELVEDRSFAKDSAEVALQIFNQFRKWQPSAVWQTVQNLRMTTLQVEPCILREVTGETGIFLN